MSANPKIYLHELVNIAGMNRPNYFEHITANWAETARIERNMHQLGVWGTVGSTGRWIEVVNVWELDGWQGLASSLEHETRFGDMMDPSLKEWWAQAVGLRSSGFDRLLLPTEYTPTLDEHLENDAARAPVYYHWEVQTRPGEVGGYLDLLRSDFMPLAEEYGLALIGAYRTSMRNESEALVIWAIRSWQDWAALEAANYTDNRLTVWRKAASQFATDWRYQLMCPAPLCPVYTGEKF